MITQTVGFFAEKIKEKQVFSGKNTKTALCSALLSVLLGSCALFEQPADTIPSHSWEQGKDYGSRGRDEAELATMAYSQGNFEEAEKYVIESLTQNPRQPQALMVGALVYEKMGRLNRARQYYEDLTIVGTEEMTILGTQNSIPERMSEVARRRLRYLNMKQSEIMIEDKDGVMLFNISQEAAGRQGKSAIEEALFAREQKLIAENKAASAADVKAAEILFDDKEKNIVSRFLIMKELAEKDLITKEEFLNGRQANIGGLLPLTNLPPAAGVEAPVPSPDLILERINSLKEAVEARAITPQEFSAERDLIVEAVLPPHPRRRLSPQAPAKDILSAAKNLRKLEVLHDLGLITADEKNKEKKEIENYLGLNRPSPQKKVQKSESASAENTTPEPQNLINISKTEPTPAVAPAPAVPTTDAAQNETVVKEEILLPEVSSPF